MAFIIAYEYFRRVLLDALFYQITKEYFIKNLGKKFG